MYKKFKFPRMWAWQWVKALPAKPSGLSSIPRVHMVEGETSSHVPTHKFTLFLKNNKCF